LKDEFVSRNIGISLSTSVTSNEFFESLRNFLLSISKLFGSLLHGLSTIHRLAQDSIGKLIDIIQYLKHSFHIEHASVHLSKFRDMNLLHYKQIHYNKTRFKPCHFPSVTTLNVLSIKTKVHQGASQLQM